MSVRFRHSFLFMVPCLAVIASCVTTAPATNVLKAGQQALIEGKITAIDLTPWTFDGNAVIQIKSDFNGLVSVQLPARWNLCKAQLVNTNVLAVGRRARVVGTVGQAGEIGVCERAEDRLQLLDRRAPRHRAVAT